MKYLIQNASLSVKTVEMFHAHHFYPLILNHTDFSFLSVFFNDTNNCYDNTASLVDECNMNMNVSAMIAIAENQSIGRKPSSSATFSSTNPTCNGLSLNLGLHGERLSHIIAAVTYHLFTYIYHVKIPLQETSRNYW